jgi:hypothetical protein
MHTQCIDMLERWCMSTRTRTCSGGIAPFYGRTQTLTLGKLRLSGLRGPYNGGGTTCQGSWGGLDGRHGEFSTRYALILRTSDQ